MKGFSPHKRKLARRRLFALATLAIILSLLSWQAVLSIRGASSVPTMSVNGTAITKNLHVYDTGRTWAGEPLYQLKNNDTVALQRINIFSWSASLLPILYIGEQLPSDIESRRPLASPPYTLPAKQSLWFVGPASAQTNMFGVIWQADGHEEYVSVKVSEGE
ncbi:hypothetical protein [Alicyclobacillus pomorum]|jgi:hypothetical protein|uniref:hypothetical protein n=1 Tax=Alicyclobacillus pomorum TaxID=204470 RepID=UPI0006877BDF|nr:hypothetical protein [Alicyclobacillus pomorum]